MSWEKLSRPFLFKFLFFCPVVLTCRLFSQKREKTNSNGKGELFMRLEGKVIIVTGAASGMGQAMAEIFSAEGAKVVISNIHGDGANQVAEAIT